MSAREASAPMPYVDLRMLRQLWHDNPPSVVIIFGIVFSLVGYAWSPMWAYGVDVLAFGAALLFGGAADEIVWLRRRRKGPHEP